MTRKVPRRRLARPGLTYVDANRHRLVEVEGDVLDIKARIQEHWPELDIFWDFESDEWVVVEHCRDGTDRLCFTTTALDQRVFDRIHRADQTRPDHMDLQTALDREEAAENRNRDRKLEDQVGEAGERLLHGLRKDGVDAGIRKIFVPSVYRERPTS